MSAGTLTPADITQLLSPGLLPQNIGKPGPELSSCQRLVGGFIESQRQLAGKLDSLHGEIASHRDHIGTLKRELSAACKRQYEEEVNMFNNLSFLTLSLP